MRVAYTSLAEHPMLAEVEAVVIRVPRLTDAELVGLAEAWHNTSSVARARAKALSPDRRLVIDILKAFDDLSHLFGDDLDGDLPYVTLDPAIVAKALKSVRDAIAGTIARPVLRRREAAALLAPWSTVVRRVSSAETPAPGRAAMQLLSAVDGLGDRCHDTQQAEAFDRILVAAMTADREEHATAVTAAFDTALSTRRRRTWSLLRHRVEATVTRTSCRTCPSSAGFDAYDRERVSMLCADAVCGLLVADALPSTQLDVLLQPLSQLVPYPRPPLGA